MIVAGIECGSKYTKSVIMVDGRIMGKGIQLTGFDQNKAFNESLHFALEEAGISMDRIERFGISGVGKELIRLDAIRVNEMKAIARAGRYFSSSACIVADIGAEEGRAVKIDKNGNPVDFVLNERCAAGTGIFIEAMARALELTVEEMGRLALQSDRVISINAQCVIFAESEVVGLIHSNTPKEDISRAIHDAIAERIASMIRRIGLKDELVLMGGVSKSPGILSALKRELNMERVIIPDEPEFGMAVGAAVSVENG